MVIAAVVTINVKTCTLSDAYDTLKATTLGVRGLDG